MKTAQTNTFVSLPQPEDSFHKIVALFMHEIQKTRVYFDESVRASEVRILDRFNQFEDRIKGISRETTLARSFAEAARIEVIKSHQIQKRVMKESFKRLYVRKLEDVEQVSFMPDIDEVFTNMVNPLEEDGRYYDRKRSRSVFESRFGSVEPGMVSEPETVLDAGSVSEPETVMDSRTRLESGTVLKPGSTDPPKEQERAPQTLSIDSVPSSPLSVFDPSSTHVLDTVGTTVLDSISPLTPNADELDVPEQAGNVHRPFAGVRLVSLGMPVNDGNGYTQQNKSNSTLVSPVSKPFEPVKSVVKPVKPKPLVKLVPQLDLNPVRVSKSENPHNKPPRPHFRPSTLNSVHYKISSSGYCAGDLQQLHLIDTHKEAPSKTPSSIYKGPQGPIPITRPNSVLSMLGEWYGKPIAGGLNIWEREKQFRTSWRKPGATKGEFSFQKAIIDYIEIELDDGRLGNLSRSGLGRLLDLFCCEERISLGVLSSMLGSSGDPERKDYLKFTLLEYLDDEDRVQRGFNKYGLV